MPANTNVLARVKSLAKRGWDAYGLLSKQSNPVLDVTVSAEAGNVITITGQVKDQIGNPLTGVRAVFMSVPADGTPSTTLAVTTGTSVAGATAPAITFETNSAGKFVATVTDAAVESIVVMLQADGCPAVVKKLTFVA